MTCLICISRMASVDARIRHEFPNSRLRFRLQQRARDLAGGIPVPPRICGVPDALLAELDDLARHAVTVLTVMDGGVA